MDEEFEYEYDEELIQQQQDDIKNVVATGPLIGEVQDIAFLQKQFTDAPRFLAKIPQLELKYQSIRCVRGDGNCFYRSYLIGCLELGLKKPAAFELMYKSINDSKVKLVTQGFSEYIIEDFWETCMEFLNVLLYLHFLLFSQ
jgi:ubiquitin thioesterase protein OTUB1